ncbi:MAG: MgtC/SapB family protein [Lachnospiraceae bacterium]|nr:MgtC/SapB family protein [Lachnospiraceae bacterium]
MTEVFNSMREMTTLSIGFRLFLALVCGGAIGLERSFKQRPAGFRTHILICMGAAITTLTSQYFYLVMHYYTDMARLGAQVVAGIGFIGAGTIIVTGNQRVKGLTTAAGLWTTAIIGLTLGGGFFEAGISATILILLTELLLTRFEYSTVRRSQEMNIYVEYQDKGTLDQILQFFRENNTKVQKIQITRSNRNKKHNASAFLSLRLGRNTGDIQLMEQLKLVKGVVSVEEL